MSLPNRLQVFLLGRSRKRAISVESTTTTTELTLPGLATPEVTPELRGDHSLERTPHKRLMVFAGRSHPELAARIADHLGVELGDIELKTFANGETYCRYCESIRGADVFLVQTGAEPVDRNVMELLLMTRAGNPPPARRTPPVTPWSPSSPQARKAKTREPI